MNESRQLVRMEKRCYENEDDEDGKKIKNKNDVSYFLILRKRCVLIATGHSILLYIDNRCQLSEWKKNLFFLLFIYIWSGFEQ